MSGIEVVGLSYYPIKACGGVEAQEVTFSEFGIEHDREWMLVSKSGTFLSQRNVPELAVVQTRIEDGSLHVSAPGMGELSPISLERDPDTEPVSVTVWKKPGTGVDQGNEASNYFSEYLGRAGVRLLRVDQAREIKPECRVDGATERTAFADSFPILLASMDSLAKLNEHLERPIPIDRFRANIIIEGAPAYDEDYWREICVGGLRAFVVRACGRCPVPEVDQRIGRKPGGKPVTEALEATRAGVDPVNDTQGVFFGQNVVHIFEPGTTVRVGNKVSVDERADERNFLLAA